MIFQGVVLNVADLERSIEFYREVLDFRLVSQKEQLAAVSAPGSDPTQVLVLRALGTSPMAGSRHIGLRAYLLEVDSADQLEEIAAALDGRRLLVSRRDHGDWRALVGRDPDGMGVVVVWHPDGIGNSEEGWQALDDFLYGVGE